MNKLSGVYVVWFCAFVIFVIFLTCVNSLSAWSSPKILLGDSVFVKHAVTSPKLTGGFPFIGTVNGINGLYLAMFGDSAVDSLIIVDTGDSIWGLSHSIDLIHSSSCVVAYRKGDTAKVLIYSFPLYGTYSDDYVWLTQTIDDAYNSDFFQTNNAHLFWLSNDSIYRYDYNIERDSFVVNSCVEVDLPTDAFDVIILTEDFIRRRIFVIGRTFEYPLPTVFIKEIDLVSHESDFLLGNLADPFVSQDMVLYCSTMEFPYHIFGKSLLDHASCGRFINIHDDDHSKKFAPRETEGVWHTGKYEDVLDYYPINLVTFYDEYGNILTEHGLIRGYHIDEVPETIAVGVNPVEIHTACFLRESDDHFLNNHFWIMWIDIFGNFWGSVKTCFCGEIEEIQSNPSLFSISIIPNPFNSSCKISAPAGSTLEIFDISGKLIRTIKMKSTEELWQPEPFISSGIYLIRTTTKTGRKLTKRIVYLK